MDKDMRKRAAQTVIDSFIVVERIYRHTYQTLNGLKESIKKDYPFKAESSMHTNPTVTSDPTSWIVNYRGLYLANDKIHLEEYKKKSQPVLFLHCSIFNKNNIEPILRYGVIEKIDNIAPIKGVRFDDFFREILYYMHTEMKKGTIKAPHCEATVDFHDKYLLDIREDKDIISLSREINDKFTKKYFG